MGSLKYRTYSEVTGADRSGLAEQVALQRQRVEARLRDVRRVVAVMSGKGGVGKSHLTAALALGIAGRAEANTVGVLDADLGAPTVAGLLGAAGPLRVDAAGVHPAVGARGTRVVSMDLLLSEGSPLRWRAPREERHLWRGALQAGALREFLSDVAWGALDLLLVDLPPGEDRLEDLAALVPDLTGAVAVTIPSEESRRAVQRTIRAALELPIRVLGVVENMSGCVCPACGAETPLFPGEAGAALAAEFGIPLLARVPFASAAEPPGLTDAFRSVLR